MPVACAAYGCSNRRKPDGGLSFFGFPLDNPELLKQWLQAMKRKQFTPSQYSKICSEHFLSSDILDRPGTYKKHLKPDAVPTLFPAMPSYYQPIPKKPRRIVQRTIPKEVTVLRSNENHQVMSSSNENNTEVEICSSVSIENQNLKIDKSVQTEEKLLDHSVIALRHKVKILQQKVRRQQLKISNLKYLTISLKKKGFVDDSIENVLLAQFIEVQ
ncbi:THAP domain-containing protein 1-like isoform X2 [Myzus persicae]|uniref:THAP domain-containing protein 1-like isoform X2 n=1 Tax=Myzus persicae TaxID=13164 RepID=UPI000B9361AC|nr:THAP domain-containing protein 1-like isoform X2 [Myzus persicae]